MAEPWSIRGTLWSLTVAVDFFLMSNPLVFIPTFTDALHKAVVLTAVVTVVSLPWLRLPGAPIELLALLGWMALSLTWSMNEAQTWTAFKVYLWVAAIAIVIAANVTTAVLIQGFTLGGVAIVVGSIYAYWAGLPGSSYVAVSRTVMTGVGTNQNILAYTLTLALAAVVSAVPKFHWQRALWLGSLATILVGIYLARSGTGFMTTVAILGAAVLPFLWERLVPRSRRWGWIAVASWFAVSVAAFLLVTRLLGKDAGTFSGRLPFWVATIHEARDRLWLGHGWGTVWMHPWLPAPENEVANRIYDEAGLVLTHGHNSAIDLLPEVGLIGTLLGATVIATAFVRALQLRGSTSAPVLHTRSTSRLVINMLVALAVFGLTEPMITIPIGWWALGLMASAARNTRVTARLNETPTSACLLGQQP